MKIRLIDADETNKKKFPNIALMKISTYHKSLGDDVNWYSHIEDMYNTDILYISKVFDFSEITKYLPINDCKIIIGGTGYDLKINLPKEIETIRNLDYSIYPDCDYSLQFLTRGCIRNCEFCLVPKKEGLIHKVIPMKIKEDSEYIKLLDNNFFAYKNWRENIDILKSYNQKIEFNQGIDLRLMNESQAKALSTLKIKTIYTAFDHYKDKDKILKGLEILTKYIKPYKITTYVLIGFGSTPEEDLERVMLLREIGVNPFAMAYNKMNDYQRAFARWVNHKATFKSVPYDKNYKYYVKGSC
jgi:hypothetical protein